MDEYFCPNCGATLNDQPGFDPDGGTWTCTACGELLMDDDVYTGDTYEGVAWFCDECGALLNRQTGFSDSYGSWTCTECGHTNGTTDEDIDEDGFSCPQCGAILNSQSGFSEYSDDWECSACGAQLHHGYSDDPYIVVEPDDADQEDEEDDDNTSSDHHSYAYAPPRSFYQSQTNTSSRSYTSSGRQTNQSSYRGPEAATRRSNNAPSNSKQGRAFSKVMFVINASIMALSLLLAITNKRVSMLPGLLALAVLTTMFYVISKTPKKAKHIFGKPQGISTWLFVFVCLVSLYVLPRIAEIAIDFASTIIQSAWR